MSDLDRSQRRDKLVQAMEGEDPRTGELLLCAGTLNSCFVRWSMDSARWWTAELAVDGFTRAEIEESARLVARAIREPQPADLVTEVKALRKNAKLAQNSADLSLKALSAVTGGARTGLVSVGIFGDIAAKLLSSKDHDSEFELRRNMSDEQIAARRDELRRSKEAKPA